MSILAEAIEGANSFAKGFPQKDFYVIDDPQHKRLMVVSNEYIREHGIGIWHYCTRPAHNKRAKTAGNTAC